MLHYESNHFFSIKPSKYNISKTLKKKIYQHKKNQKTFENTRLNRL